MKTVTIASVFSVVMASTPLAEPNVRAETEAAHRVSIAVDPGRAQWPIVREPSGRWGIVGEGVARNTGAQPIAIRSITFTVMSQVGRPLMEEVFDTPDALGEIVKISFLTPSGARTWKPLGTTTLDPGDIGVAFLAGLTEPQTLPGRAQVTMRFSRGPAQTFTVPLEAFNPGQRMGWPLRVDSEPWLALNTAGTAQHWTGGAVLTHRDLFISQRFAIDLVQVDAGGQTRPASATRKEDYYAWGEEVLSTGHGRVVAVVSDRRDLEIGETLSPAEHPAGNHIVIQHGPRLFSVYAHLQQGSAIVAIGDLVERGQVVGRVGNSGNTSEPHLHVHFTDAFHALRNPISSFYFSQGLPAAFWGVLVLRDGNAFRLNGSTPLESDIVVSRTFVP